MIKLFSRRDFLGTSLAAGILPILPAVARAAVSSEPKRLVAGTRTLEVNGRPAKVFGLIGPDGRPGIRLAAGERFQIELANETGVNTIVHWHGQLPPWTQMGSPGPKPRRSRTVLFKATTTLRLPARIGCIRITKCRNRA
jgi:FtsP/CotA-like multicopper oxidase with cupredoxin domain